MAKSGSVASLNLQIRPHLNIIVGDNESGKSTLLEAINLVGSAPSSCGVRRQKS
ncbi:AAA family ATPase [Tunturibacter empetritectus]|uniref:AAA family ATPase n=1 Tax=Tunturiibacter empetritectus TaxID=3069691 RepID=UPI0016075B70